MIDYRLNCINISSALAQNPHYYSNVSVGVVGIDYVFIMNATDKFNNLVPQEFVSISHKTYINCY